MGVLAYVGLGVFIIYLTISLIMWHITPKDLDPEDLERQKHAAVVVLGDLGHSPRMNFHALSIAKAGWKVSLIGYVESELMEEVRENESIEIVALPPPKKRANVPYIVYAIQRVLGEHVRLYRTLKSLGSVDVVLVQNPPSIPTLGAARWYTLWGRPGTKLLIDWHNLGYSILALTQRRFFVTAYRAYELVFGRIAYLHLVVSVRLGVVLKMDLAINPKRVLPLPDRPYKTYVESDKQRQLIRNSADSFVANITTSPKSKLVVTSTSYTPDEDLGIFLDALETLDKRLGDDTHVDAVVTGKGPDKEAFLERVATMKLKHVTVRTAWLAYEDYHKLLAVADIGVSLHKSSSGVDLPMKVVDMFGAGLPVVALNFPALKELVKPTNGKTFENYEELADGLYELFTDDNEYFKLKTGALNEANHTWQDQWNEKVGPVFGVGQYTGEESSSSSSDSE